MNTTPEIAGRVIITWPASAGGQVPGWGVTAHDADTGEHILDATSLTISHGDPGGWNGAAITVRLTRLLDANGTPVSSGMNNVAPSEEAAAYKGEHGSLEGFDGEMFRTAEFRYVVAEMRVAEDPAIPTVRSVAEGRHTIDQYQEHLGRQQLEAWELAGVKLRLPIRPDPDAVLTVSYPDTWRPEQVQEFCEKLSAHLPGQRIVMVSESLRVRIDPDTDLAEYTESILPGGTHLVQHAVDGCWWTGTIDDPNTLGDLVAAAVQHHAERHTQPKGIITSPDVTLSPEEEAELKRRFEESLRSQP
jgi:hypothetical protein